MVGASRGRAAPLVPSLGHGLRRLNQHNFRRVETGEASPGRSGLAGEASPGRSVVWLSPAGGTADE